MIVPLAKRVEQGKRRVDQQDEPQDVVYLHDVGEAEHSENMRLVNDQAGEDQHQDGAGLQPVPKPFICIVHVDSPGRLMSVRMPAVADKPANRMDRDAEGNTQEHQQAEDIYPVQAVKPDDVITRGMVVGLEDGSSLWPGDDCLRSIPPAPGWRQPEAGLRADNRTR